MTKEQQDFLKELIELQNKHGLCAVPTYMDSPSAHDPMYIVSLDEFWKNYFNRRIYAESDDE